MHRRHNNSNRDNSPHNHALIYHNTAAQRHLIVVHVILHLGDFILQLGLNPSKFFNGILLF
jgi:hypothetical protein